MGTVGGDFRSSEKADISDSPAQYKYLAKLALWLFGFFSATLYSFNYAYFPIALKSLEDHKLRGKQHWPVGLLSRKLSARLW